MIHVVFPLSMDDGMVGVVRGTILRRIRDGTINMTTSDVSQVAHCPAYEMTALRLWAKYDLKQLVIIILLIE